MATNYPEVTDKSSVWICEAGGDYGATPVKSLTDASNGIVVAAGNKFTCATADFFKNLQVGQRIKTAGFATEGNNGYFTITAIKTDDYKEITVDGTLTEETADKDATISPCWWPLRFTGEGFKPESEKIESDEIVDSRRVADVFKVHVSAAGDVSGYLSYPQDSGVLNALGRLFQGLFESRFTMVSKTGTGASNDFKFGNGDGTITGPEGAWASFAKGHWVRVSGCEETANDGIYKITDKSSTVLTVTKPYVTGWTGFTTKDTSKAVVKMCGIRDGYNRLAFNLEKRYAQNSLFEYYTGLRVTSGRIDINERRQVEFGFNFQGRTTVPGSSTVSGADMTASTNKVYTSGANVAYILENNASLTTVVKRLNISFDNSPRERNDVRDAFAKEIPFGKIHVTGTLDVLFDSLTLYNKVLQDTESSIVVLLSDGIFPAGNVIVLTVPKVQFKGGPSITRTSEDVPLTLEFLSKEDSATSCVMQIDLL